MHRKIQKTKLKEYDPFQDLSIKGWIILINIMLQADYIDMV
jgi:hypothetical protein